MNKKTALNRLEHQLMRPISIPWVQLLQRLSHGEEVWVPAASHPAIMGYRTLLAVGAVVPEGGRLRLLEPGRRLLWIALGNAPEAYAA